MASPSSGGLNNRFNSYQQSGGYVPPGQTYADQQTRNIRETTQTQYQAEQTANTVLQQLHTQRTQLQGANDMTWDMRQATEQTKRELQDLRAKYRQRKMRLWAIIAVLATTDFVLFLRLLRCGGSFFCRQRY